MPDCAVCANNVTERCHVLSKAEYQGPHDDFHNIIHLCHRHHREFFDDGRMVIDLKTKTCYLLVDYESRKIEKIKLQRPIVVKPEYIEWKNSRAHIFLKAELRRSKKANKASGVD